MAYIGMAYIRMAYIVMALYGYGRRRRISRGRFSRSCRDGSGLSRWRVRTCPPACRYSSLYTCLDTCVGSQVYAHGYTHGCTHVSTHFGAQLRAHVHTDLSDFVAGSISALYRHRRRHVLCAGTGVPVLKMTSLERRPIPAHWTCRRRCRYRDTSPCTRAYRFLRFRCGVDCCGAGYVSLWLYIGSLSASPTACRLCGYGRAGTQNDRLGVPSAMPR